MSHFIKTYTHKMMQEEDMIFLSCHCKILHENTELLTYFYILLCFQEEIGCEVSCCFKQFSSERWREKRNPNFTWVVELYRSECLGCCCSKDVESCWSLKLGQSRLTKQVEIKWKSHRGGRARNEPLVRCSGCPLQSCWHNWTWSNSLILLCQGGLC